MVSNEWCRPPSTSSYPFVKALKNCRTIIDYFEAKDVIIIKNSLFQFLTMIPWFHVRTFTMKALSTILGQIMKFCWLCWSTWIIISVNCYSVTYELTYHHFPNPIESVGKSVLSSTFTPYTWLTSLILYRMFEKRWQGG